jgi:hypothetical protein
MPGMALRYLVGELAFRAPVAFITSLASVMSSTCADATPAKLSGALAAE